ncbi:MAG: PDZ domain-containing protein [Chitinophagaceae bacterium]|nr:MAG: PDZ domain-containing protein [Chitinophagaceae bacterium]
MKRLPIILVLVLAGIFFATRSQGKSTTLPPGKYEKILQIVGAILTQGHYEPKDLNDDFSKKIYDKYFSELDPEKNIFLQEDVKSLERYSTKLDDEVKGAPVQFFIEAGKLFDQRVKEVEGYYKEILAKPFDFTKDEIYVSDGEKKSFPAIETARKEQWRKYLKYLTLQRYADLVDGRESNKGKEGAVIKSDAELEKESREKVQAAMARTFDRMHKSTEEDKFNSYVNTITEMMDPHTEFMPPLDKRYFDETMSGKFYGIGAQLTYDEGNIKIASVLPGGPAQKNGQVEAGDIIVRVAQPNEAPVELSGFTVQDAVKLIRGKKDSNVTLTLRKKDGTLKTLNLKRDEIVQDEAYVRSAVINEGAQKVGYIYLPEFYADFQEMNGVRSGMDVAKEVNKLKAEGVDGIVIDLRNNGGGALYDVIQIAGLFIDQGPVVQVRDRQGKPQVMRDRDEGVVYDGPLVVMVNEMSASASEILAAAVQDYGRGVVIGSTSTYGKGTVQRTIGLDPESNFSNTNSELGSLKLTLQKFYRISGGSTQQKGVVPDVVIPDYLEYLKIREKNNPYSLPYDEISKASYPKWNPGYSLDAVKQTASTRIANDTTFKRIQEASVFVGKQNDRSYSLQLDKYRQDQKQVREAVKKIENLTKLPNPLPVNFLKQDESKYVSADKDKTERYKQWLTGVSKDVYVDQAVKVVKDIVAQQNMAKAEKKEPVRAF